MLDRIRSLHRPDYVLVLYCLAVFLLGGGARDDIVTLAILRPLSVMALAYGLVVLDPARLQANRALALFAAAWAGLVVLHLVPLPPQIWHNLPGRELAVAIDGATGLADKWRPISLVPYRTVNSLLSLTVPLAALVLAINLTREQLRLTVFALVALAFVSAILSLLQVIGGPGNAFYLYRITNADSAVGLFANRNHNAILLSLAIVMLGTSTALRPAPRELRRGWMLIMGGAALALVPFLVITQSRAGLVLGVLALGAAAWMQRQPQVTGRSRRAKPPINPALVAGTIGAVALAALTWLMTAGNALERLTRGGTADDELRLRIWPGSWELAWQHFPLGSGIGTFVEVYEAGEPASTLGPIYINHAHNDFLELAMTGGVPAIALLLAAILWLIPKGFREFSGATGGDRSLRLLGLITLGFFALGSLYDYPLRTPSLAIVFILALVWIAGREPLASPETAPAIGSEKQVRRSEAETPLAPQTGM